VRKRRLVLGRGAGGLLACLLLLLALPRHRINREGFEAIQVGMSEQEVEGVLGGPPGDYSTGEVESGPLQNKEDIDLHFTLPEPASAGDLKPQTWEGNQGLVVVLLGKDRKVAAKAFQPRQLKSLDPLKVLCRLLRL
jgi:hypothetical protein